jgi:uncharacterized repeat protein (TIGR03803 family)
MHPSLKSSPGFGSIPKVELGVKMNTEKLTLTKLGGWGRFCAVVLFCVTTTLASQAQTFKTLVTLDYTNGSSPTDSLIQGFDGNLYGTTNNGGKGLYGDGWGTAFKMSRAGNLTTLYNFCTVGGACADGSSPVAGLTLAEDGNFYGATSTGGVSDYCNESSRCGTIFKLTPTGVLTTLHNFCNQLQCSDGENPLGTLVQGTNGVFYGTTSFGTDNANAGTLFSITAGGAFTGLYDFCSENCADGWDPQSGLVQGADGNFYGMAPEGGLQNCAPQDGCGTIFKISPRGQFTVFYSFCPGGTPCADGENPFGGLVQGVDGNFYGTNIFGGANGEGGTVFKITPSGALTTLYSFCSLADCADGSYPQGTLIQGTDGNFYGTTAAGGHHGCANPNTGLTGCGTIFKITPSGTFTTLYEFCHGKGCPDGSNPHAGLMQATDGNFYGTAYDGGMLDCEYQGFECGSIYRLSVGLGPFVKLLRDAGKEGDCVNVLGQGFEGTTGVFLNGTPMTFTVDSDTHIGAHVPAGATSGYVTVETPSGTLTSNVIFQVKP